MATGNKIFLGSDHAGFSMKKELLEYLRKDFPENHFEDLGCMDESSVDYPDLAQKVAARVGKGEGRGILVCGSGIGMCISANKIDGIRAASAWDVTSARLSREHNDSNIVCLGSRLTGIEVAKEVLRTWLKTPFQGGRHEKRVGLIRALEKGV